MRTDAWEIKPANGVVLGQLRFRKNWEISFHFQPTQVGSNWESFIRLTDGPKTGSNIVRVIGLWLKPGTLEPRLHYIVNGDGKTPLIDYPAINLRQWNSFVISQQKSENGRIAIQTTINGIKYPAIVNPVPVEYPKMKIYHGGADTGHNTASGLMKNLIIKTW